MWNSCMDIDRSTVGEQHMSQVVSMFENIKAKYNTDKIYKQSYLCKMFDW